MTIRKILVAYDGSENSKKSLSWAVFLHASIACSVEVVAVVKAPEFSTSIDEVDEFFEDGEKAAAPLLEEAAHFMLENGVPDAKATILRGHPAESIIHYAESNQFDLIIIGNRGMGGFKKLIMGSIANKVATYSNVPVLIMK